MNVLPNDKSALLEEVASLRLLGPNPSLEKPRAKLIESIYRSMTIRRSLNHVSILLVGKTGVGKSSTINHLLGVELAKTSDSTSETRSTKEFIVYGNDPEYEVKELPLGLIDTPGFCDTDGSMQDACNVLSVQEFFRTHPALSDCYPNLIFLFVRATDNRMIGENSELKKSLRCIKEFELIDPKNPNVVTILTQSCSIRRQTGKEWAKELDKIKSNVSKVVFDNLKVYSPVVLIENTYKDCGLKRRGDYTVLPNKELQPKNLYLACAKVLKENNDKLGLITLNSIFAHPKMGRLVKKSGHELQRKIANQCTDDKEIMNLVKRLEIAARGVRDPIYDTISKYIQEQELQGDKKEELMKIAGVLSQFREGDSPTFGLLSINTIEYVLDKEISDIGRNMLEQKFKIAVEPAGKVSESARLVGQGYNICTGKSAATQVMKFEAAMKYGIAIPACAKFEKVQQSRSFMEVFEDEKSYTQSRLKSLNVNLTVKPKIFKMDFSAGYNKKSDSTSSSSMSEYSFLFEQRLFELKLGNYREYLNHGLTFTEDFKLDVQKLPSEYDKSDDKCVSKFEEFFNRYGHFLVSSAYGGGSVEIKCSRKAVESRKASLTDAKLGLTSTLEGWNLAETNVSVDGGNSDDQKIKNLLKQSALSWEGGDPTFQAKEVINDSKMFQKWKNSLLQKPMMLTSEMTLEPISTTVGCEDDEKKDATYDALKNLLGSEIEMHVKKEATHEEVQEENQDTRLGTIKKLTFPKCFPYDSIVKVQNKDGDVKQKKMANLDVGDKVMGWDVKRNQTVFTKVIMFAHLAPDAVDVKYLKITLEDENKITLSDNHLVMAGKQTKAILARKVKPGDTLFSVDKNQEISANKVLAIEKVIEQGIFCPITLSGNVIVDNVLASCYASVEDHVLLKGLVNISAQNMAHLGLMPMRALHKLRSKWLRKIPNGQTIHPYVQWLCKLNHPCMVHEHA